MGTWSLLGGEGFGIWSLANVDFWVRVQKGLPSGLHFVLFSVFRVSSLDRQVSVLMCKKQPS